MKKTHSFAIYGKNAGLCFYSADSACLSTCFLLPVPRYGVFADGGVWRKCNTLQLRVSCPEYGNPVLRIFPAGALLVIRHKALALSLPETGRKRRDLTLGVNFLILKSDERLCVWFPHNVRKSHIKCKKPLLFWHFLGFLSWHGTCSIYFVVLW